MDFLGLEGLVGPIEGIARRILDYALLLSAVGTITMALVELLKGVTLARRHYHRFMIERWLRRAQDPAGAGAELLELAAGGKEDAAALFEQSSGKLLGQIQAAANVALDFPAAYPRLYAFLARPDPGATRRASDDDVWASFCRAELAPRRRKVGEPELRAASQARARLGNLVTRRLDALQNTIDYRWARLNQAVAVLGGFVFLLIVLLNRTPRLSLIQVIPVSLTGGLVAPLAKDLVSALGNLRAGRG